MRADHVDNLRERAARAERSRLAREVHDVVAHSLAVMVSQAEGARMVAGTDPGKAAPVFATIARTGREALTELRSLVSVLREDPDTPADPREPQPDLADVPALLEQVRAAGLSVAFREQGHPGQLTGVGGLTAYRVVQEGLTNVVKHAGPGTRATVALLWRPDALEIEVTDDGAGGVGPAAEDLGGHGLDGMRERVEMVGGRLQTRPTDDGWRIAARIPQREEVAR